MGIGRSLLSAAPCSLAGWSQTSPVEMMMDEQSRGFASRGRATSSKTFRPRRRPNKNYRPFRSKNVVGRRLVDKFPELMTRLGEDVPGADNETAQQLGHTAGHLMEELKRSQAIKNSPGGHLHDEMEEKLRMADYFTAEDGTTEALAFERRAMETWTDEQKKKFFEMRDMLVDKAEEISVTNDIYDNEERILKEPKKSKNQELDKLFLSDEQYAEFYGGDGQSPQETNFEPNRRAHGEWTNMVVDVRRGVHLWRGGRLQTFRAMVVGGNLNGCGGFGVGSHTEPLKAIEIASRKARRNIFFVDRYRGNGLTGDLVGTQNSCRVVIRAVDNGIRGNPLVKEILLRMGITNAACKAYGKRHLWAVVRATFKALLTHQSIEHIAMKRGRRLLSVDRSVRMKV